MGSSSQQSSSRPLTAAERAETYDKALSYLGQYIPQTSNYKSYGIIDPSADRGRGVQSNGSYGYGYNNVAALEMPSDNSKPYYDAYQAGANSTVSGTNDAVTSYLDDYFAKRDAAAREAANMSQGG